MNNYNFEMTNQGLKLTGSDDEPIHAVVPAYVDGEPVKVIGRYAFSAQPKLKSVTLPATVNRIDAYAFYNSCNLEQLNLSAGVRYIDGGSFKRCNKLHTITMKGQQHLNQLMADIYNEVTVEITLEDGSFFKILLPEYYYTYEEFVQPRLYNAVNYNSGTYYRNALLADRINFAIYDKAFIHSVLLDEPRTVILLALYRLHYPYQLEDAAREDYKNYLAQHREEAASFLLEKEDWDLLESFLALDLYDAASLQELIRLASDRELAQAVSLMMDYKLKHFGQAKKKKKFAL